ncbi:hypothetical protein BHE74_00040183 [Ensete ventricosum]|nr:hypothetical protein BHE74_00040183 [Ensete ventricosum]
MGRLPTYDALELTAAMLRRRSLFAATMLQLPRHCCHCRFCFNATTSSQVHYRCTSSPLLSSSSSFLSSFSSIPPSPLPLHPLFLPHRYIGTHRRTMCRYTGIDRYIAF